MVTFGGFLRSCIVPAPTARRADAASIQCVGNLMRRRARTLYLANNGEDCRGAEHVGSVVIGIGHVAPAEGAGAHSGRRGLGGPEDARLTALCEAAAPLNPFCEAISFG